MLTVTHKSPRGKGKQIFGQEEIKNYFPRKRKALQEAGKGGSAERFCEEEKGKCLKFSRNRDSQFIWSGRDWVPSRPANDLAEEEEEDNEDSVNHLQHCGLVRNYVYGTAVSKKVFLWGWGGEKLKKNSKGLFPSCRGSP